MRRGHPTQHMTPQVKTRRRREDNTRRQDTTKTKKRNSSNTRQGETIYVLHIYVCVYKCIYLPLHLLQMVTRLGVRMSDVEVRAAFEAIDDDGGGTLGIDEFENWLAEGLS
jgi:hypothetical protein